MVAVATGVCHKHRFQQAMATVQNAQIPTQASTQNCWILNVFSSTYTWLAVPEAFFKLLIFLTLTL